MTYITVAGYHNHDNQQCLRVSTAVIKDHDQEQVGKERMYFSFQFHCTVHYSGSSQMELKTRRRPWDRSWCRGHAGVMSSSLLLMECLVCLLIAPRTTSCVCVGGLLTVSRVLPHKLLIKKMHYRFAHRPVWWSYFLNWGSFFPNDSDLCQDDIKVTSSSMPEKQRTRELLSPWSWVPQEPKAGTRDLEDSYRADGLQSVSKSWRSKGLVLVQNSSNCSNNKTTE